MPYMTYSCDQKHNFHSPALLIKVKDDRNTIQVPVCPICESCLINPVEDTPLLTQPQGPFDSDIVDFIDVETPEKFKEKKAEGFVFFKEYSKFIRMVKHAPQAEAPNAYVEERQFIDGMNGPKSQGFTLKLELANGEKVWLSGARIVDPSKLIEKPADGGEILCGLHCHICEEFPDDPALQAELCPNPKQSKVVPNEAEAATIAAEEGPTFYSEISEGPQ